MGLCRCIARPKPATCARQASPDQRGWCAGSCSTHVSGVNVSGQGARGSRQNTWARYSAGCRTASIPSNVTLPACGADSPANRRNRLALPVPSPPCIRDSPAGKSALQSWNRLCPGNPNPRPCTCSTGALLVGCDDMVSTFRFIVYGTASAARHEAAFSRF